MPPVQPNGTTATKIASWPAKLNTALGREPKRLFDSLFFSGAIVIFGFLFWRPDDSSWSALWIEPWAAIYLLVGLMLLRFVYFTGMKSLPILGFLAYYMILCALSAYKSGFHGDDELRMLLRSASMDQLVGCFAFLAFVMLRLNFSKALLYSSWIVMVSFLFAKDPTLQVPFFHNPSMAATYVVLASGVGFFSVIAAAITHSWTAFIAWSASMLWLKARGAMSRAFLIAMILVAVLSFKESGIKIPDNGRFAFISSYMHWWSELEPSQIAFGVGPGTTRVYLPKVNFEEAATTQTKAFMIYPWLHNDFLQLIVEAGIVGLILFVLAAFDLWRRASEKQRSFLVAIAASMMTNFPAHWPLHMLVIWTLVIQILFRIDPEVLRQLLKRESKGRSPARPLAETKSTA